MCNLKNLLQAIFQVLTLTTCRKKEKNRFSLDGQLQKRKIKETLKRIEIEPPKDVSMWPFLDLVSLEASFQKTKHYVTQFNLKFVLFWFNFSILRTFIMHGTFNIRWHQRNKFGRCNNCVFYLKRFVLISQLKCNAL